MAKTQFFYRLDTLQIDAVFRGNKTQSHVFKDPSTYVEVNVKDPPYVVSRNHEVILDDDGNVLDTRPSLNPMQPAPLIDPLKTLIDSLHSYGVHSYTPDQVDDFIDSVDTVAELRALLKIMAKCIIAYAEFFES